MFPLQCFHSHISIPGTSRSYSTTWSTMTMTKWWTHARNMGTCVHLHVARSIVAHTHTHTQSKFLHPCFSFPPYLILTFPPSLPHLSPLFPLSVPPSDAWSPTCGYKPSPTLPHGRSVRLRSWRCSTILRRTTSWPHWWSYRHWQRASTPLSVTSRYITPTPGPQGFIQRGAPGFSLPPRQTRNLIS